MKRFLIVPILVVVVAASVQLHAQYSTNRNLRLDRLAAFGAVYDTSRAMFQVKYPYLTSLPPYSSSTYNQFVAYTALDSALRIMSRSEIIDWIDGLSAWDDTTKALTKYLYAVKDDDPGLFTQFTTETALRRHARNIYLSTDTTASYDSTSVGMYKCSFREVRGKLVEKLVSLWPTDSTRLAFAALMQSDIIVRGTVQSIDTVENKLNGRRTLSYAAVLATTDTIKGQVQPGVSNRTYPPGHPLALVVSPGPPSNTLLIEYLPEVYPRYMEFSPNGDNGLTRDSAFANVDGSFKISDGQDVVVFLSHVNGLLDDDNDYYNLRVSSASSFGAMPVVSGQVRDVNAVWSSTPLQLYSTWRSQVDSIINIILQ